MRETTPDLTRISKYISLILRHKPEVQEGKELNGDYDFYRPIIRVEAI